jgi:hypothetical protein
MLEYTLRPELQEGKAMNFRKATDALLESVTLEDLAAAMGVSIQAVRQARVAEGSTAFRSPPKGWEVAAARLAARRASKFDRLAQGLSSAN